MTDPGILEDRLGYRFKDKDLFETALTHSSYSSEAECRGDRSLANNERLEFIGDAYLDAIVGRILFDMLPDEREGQLSKKRANVVCERSLAGIARTIGLGGFLRLGNGEELTGGRDKDSILADALEALIGAVVTDSGYEAAHGMVSRLFAENIRLSAENRLYVDYKTELQEKIQDKHKKASIKYETVSETGPDHNKSFTVAVALNGAPLASGTGKSKKEAEQQAAMNALTKGEF